MEFLRVAGYNERRCIARDVLGLYGTIVTAGIYSLKNNTTAQHSRECIIEAVRACITKHPVLCTIVQNADTETPRLAKIFDVQAAQHVQYLDSMPNKTDDLTDVRYLLQVAHQASHIDYSSRPQWQLYVLPLPPVNGQSRLVVGFACSHALADGMSGLSFHKTLLAVLRQQQATTASDAKVLSALDQITQLPLSWSYFLRILAIEFLPISAKRFLGIAGLSPSEAWYGASQRPVAPRPGRQLPTEIYVASLPQDFLQTLVEVCRRRKSRLTGLLNHLTARAVSLALRRRGQNYQTFVVETAIDLRRCIPQAQDRMANFASAITETHTVDEPTQAMTDREWAFVQQTTENLLKASTSLNDQAVALLKYVSDMRDWAIGRSKTPASTSFAVSNLGSFDSDGSVGYPIPWSIEEMFFSQSADGTGSPFNINFVSAKTGSLSITLTWWLGMLGVEDETAFGKEICDNLVQQAKLVQ